MNESEKVTKITETGTIGWDSEIPKAVSQSDQVSKSLHYYKIPNSN